MEQVIANPWSEQLPKCCAEPVRGHRAVAGDHRNLRDDRLLGGAADAGKSASACFGRAAAGYAQAVVWQGLKTGGAGVVIGPGSVLWLTRVLGSMLFGVKRGPSEFGGVALALLSVAAGRLYSRAPGGGSGAIAALRQQ